MSEPYPSKLDEQWRGRVIAPGGRVNLDELERRMGATRSCALSLGEAVAVVDEIRALRKSLEAASGLATVSVPKTRPAVVLRGEIAELFQHQIEGLAREARRQGLPKPAVDIVRKARDLAERFGISVYEADAGLAAGSLDKTLAFMRSSAKDAAMREVAQEINVLRLERDAILARASKAEKDANALRAEVAALKSKARRPS